MKGCVSFIRAEVLLQYVYKNIYRHQTGRSGFGLTNKQSLTVGLFRGRSFQKMHLFLRIMKSSM